MCLCRLLDCLVVVRGLSLCMRLYDWDNDDDWYDWFDGNIKLSGCARVHWTFDGCASDVWRDYNSYFSLSYILANWVDWRKLAAHVRDLATWIEICKRRGNVFLLFFMAHFLVGAEIASVASIRRTFILQCNAKIRKEIERRRSQGFLHCDGVELWTRLWPSLKPKPIPNSLVWFLCNER